MSSKLVPSIKDNDWQSIRQAIDKLSALYFRTNASPNFGSVTVNSDVDIDNDLNVTGTATLNDVDISGGIAMPIVTKSANYTIVSTDYTVLATASDGAITVTLPASPAAGRIFNVKCINDDNTCTVARNGNTIDGDASDLTLIEDESVTLQANSDGNWWII